MQTTKVVPSNTAPREVYPQDRKQVERLIAAPLARMYIHNFSDAAIGEIITAKEKLDAAHKEYMHTLMGTMDEALNIRR